MALGIQFTHSLRSFVAAVELNVADGATFALVGPSGAGKTTALRVVSGLVRPDEGRVVAGGATWLDTAQGIDIAPEHRRVGYLFQEYALFPHLDVAGNVRFGASDAAAVGSLLERFRISHLASARIHELSGGERQRVALARALARDPAVLLLDEPLAALDAHTRADVRSELHEIVAALAIPTLLVTHDFEDAAALADIVGVIVEGRILQLGSPSELVAMPADPFVASFTGATLLPGMAAAGPNGLTEVALDAGMTAWSTDPGHGRVALSIYPWEVSVGREMPVDTALNHIRAPIVSLVELGNRVRLRVGPLAAEVTAGSAARLGLREGEVVVASFKATAARVLPL
jgi:ABC-type sulfate/molybdate transport systems ATPase subunit